MLQTYKLLIDHCEENMEHRLFLEEMVDIEYFPNLRKAHIKYRKLSELIDADSLYDAYCTFKRGICYYSMKAMMIEEQIEREINHELQY